MNKVYKIDITKNFDFSIYSDATLLNIMNEYNKITYKDRNKILYLQQQDFFKVPHVEFSYLWGKEKVFYPFSSKLFKVLDTNLADTSLQLHPLKTEKYYCLNDNTSITDTTNNIKFKKGEYVSIPNNTIHSLLKGSRVFEEQDNLIFDNVETIRINDKLNRKVSTPQEYVKYLLPQFSKKFSKENLSNYNGENSKFIFVADGEVEIECNNEKTILNEKEELYYLSKQVKINEVKGYVRIIECEFYKLGD